MKAEPLLRVEVESRSTPGKVYVVTQWASDNWKCSCPRWIFVLQKEGENCKHIEVIRFGEAGKEIRLSQKNEGRISYKRTGDKTSPKIGTEKVLLRKLLID